MACLSGQPISDGLAAKLTNAFGGIRALLLPRLPLPDLLLLRRGGQRLFGLVLLTQHWVALEIGAEPALGTLTAGGPEQRIGSIGGHLSLLCFSLEIAQEPAESSLKCVVVFPATEVRHKILAHLDGQILATVGVEALPLADRVP